MKIPNPVAPPQVQPTQDEEPVIDMEQPPMDEPQDETDVFGKEKFDAGIDVDEDADPKKYIEKLTGKLAQKLRDYNGIEQDVDLNKFVVNSLIPASVPQMDETDAKDVIKKVQDNIGQAGQESNEVVDNQELPGQEVGQGDEQEELSPIPESRVVNDDEIEDLVNEIIAGKGVKRNVQHKNPFKSPKFKK